MAPGELLGLRGPSSGKGSVLVDSLVSQEKADDTYLPLNYGPRVTWDPKPGEGPACLVFCNILTDGWKHLINCPRARWGQSSLTLSEIATGAAVNVAFRVWYEQGEYRAQRREMGVFGPGRVHAAPTLEQAVLLAVGEALPLGASKN